MNKVIKLLVLILLSLSVYFIYKQTENKTIKILTLGDSLSLGINSSGSKSTSYIDYYKNYLTSSSREVQVIDKYAREDLSIKELKNTITTNPDIKRELIECHKLFITIGYNDILYMLSLEEDIPHFNKISKKIENNYNSLIKEIRKYYKDEIIVVGYYKSGDDYYKNILIKRLNKYLENNKEITYIDTYHLISNNKKYLPNPNSYFPNQAAYKLIGDKIIKETLAK